MAPTDTDPRVARVQIELLRRAGPTRRLGSARALSTFVIGLARRALARRHPELSAEELGLRFVALHYGEELAARVQQHLARTRG